MIRWELIVSRQANFRALCVRWRISQRQRRKLLKRRRRRREIRPASRLDSFYDELKKIHKEHFCDWRFGQLGSNFFGWLASEEKVDLFFPEEEQMIKYIREFAGIKENQGR